MSLKLKFITTQKLHSFYKMGAIEWAIWANENAIASSCVVILGGILAVCGQFRFWEIGAYAIILGVLMLFLEYPRGKRQKGTSYERKSLALAELTIHQLFWEVFIKHAHMSNPSHLGPLQQRDDTWNFGLQEDFSIWFQYPLTVVVCKGRLLTRNYLVRFVAYLVISIPCCFILPTVLGAMCYMMTSFIYLMAGIRGEEWVPIARKLTEQGPTIIEEPRHPPPRQPNHGITQQGKNRL